MVHDEFADRNGKHDPTRLEQGHQSRGVHQKTSWIGGPVDCREMASVASVASGPPLSCLSTSGCGTVAILAACTNDVGGVGMASVLFVSAVAISTPPTSFWFGSKMTSAPKNIGTSRFGSSTDAIVATDTI